MSLANADEWAAKFMAAQTCFEVDQEIGALGVYLLGCKTGCAARDARLKLHVGVARGLATALDMPVMCVGTYSKIESDDIQHFLTNFDDITRQLSAGGDGVSRRSGKVTYESEFATP